MFHPHRSGGGGGVRACSAVIRSSKGFQNLGSLAVIPSREVRCGMDRSCRVC